MPKVKISEYSATANSNTDVASINIDEGCAPSGINNAIRAVMGHLKDFQQGTYGDPFNGPVNGTVGATTANTGAFTTLTTTGTINLITVGLGAGAVSTNTAVGASALAANTSGGFNTAVGYQAGSSNTTGGAAITAFGYQAGKANTSGFVSAFGFVALAANTSGANNAAFGAVTLAGNTTGSFNTGIGDNALASNTTASNNTAVGYQAGYSNTTGIENVFLGSQAGYSSTTASGSVYLGYYSGQATTGLGNTFIGNGSGYLVTSGTKNTILGKYNGNAGGLDIRTASNYIVLSDGDGNPRAYWTNNAYLHINNTNNRNGTSIFYASNDVLNIHTDQAAGNATSLIAGWYSATSSTTGSLCLNITSNGNITNLNNSYGGISDAKLKENIVDASPKLANIMQVKVRNYNLIGETQKQIGVIAQELEQVFPGMVDESPDKDIDGDDLGTKTKSVKYSVFVPILIKAIQELKAEVDSLKSQLNGASA